MAPVKKQNAAAPETEKSTRCRERRVWRAPNTNDRATDDRGKEIETGKNKKGQPPLITPRERERDESPGPRQSAPVL